MNPDSLPSRLRDQCAKIRTRAVPLSDLIPLMQQAADALELAAAPQGAQPAADADKANVVSPVPTKTIPPALPLMSAGFCTSVSYGPARRYDVVFSFRSLEAMQAAHREWVEFAQALPAGEPSGGADVPEAADIVLQALSGPTLHPCGMCSGHGFYGSPGQRCTFCKGTGKLTAWPDDRAACEASAGEVPSDRPEPECAASPADAAPVVPQAVRMLTRKELADGLTLFTWTKDQRVVSEIGTWSPETYVTDFGVDIAAAIQRKLFEVNAGLTIPAKEQQK